MEPSKGMETSEGSYDYTQDKFDLRLWATSDHIQGSPTYQHLGTNEYDEFEPIGAGLNTSLGHANLWSPSFIPCSGLAHPPDAQIPILQERNIYEPPVYLHPTHQLVSTGIRFSAPSQLPLFNAASGSSHDPKNSDSFGAILTENDDEAIVDMADLTNATDTKVVKVYPCILDEHCSYTASSKRDLLRHLQSDKHGKDYVQGLPSWDRSYCEVPGCKFADEGFSRRDNMLRHMLKVHGIELDKEKPGPKKNVGR
ncbi:hypothetical protein E0Z10_g7868 [Xylaria hypoxylon]|uniref:C2H2-type domain-containing protein n=1 Tax=Xylaria hypoxylon TaxID=37992 RepID=A0A4Z0YTU6_9PEZI|nr:hypothetical protein E0Z10_g7868 [Xylaria hypoxylon]